MTVINHKSISGITSITAPAGSDDLLTVHTNDTTERFRIVDSGAIVTGVTTASNFKTGTSNLHNVGVEVAGINVLGADTPIGTGATIYNSGAAVFTGIVTARNGINVSGGTATFAGAIDANSTFEVSGIANFDSTVKISDKIEHLGDDNTNIRFPGPDQIQLDTGGTNYLKLHRYASVNFVEVGASAAISLANNGANARAILIGDANHTSTGRILMQAGAGSQGHGGAVTLYSHANSTNAGGVYIGKSLNSSGSIIFGNGGTSPNSEYLRINSSGQIITGGGTGISHNNVGNSAFGSFFEVNGSHTINHHGVLGISGRTNTNNARTGLIQFLNTENSNSSSNASANSRALAHISVYADTSDSNAGDDSGGRIVIGTKGEAAAMNDLVFLTSDKTVGIQAIPAVGDMNSTATGGAALSDPKLYVYDGGTNGKYALMMRCNAGDDADNTGSAIALNHSNDRGILIEGGRWSGNRAWGAIKAIDNIGRVTDGIAIRGGDGQGIQDIRIYTGEAVATTERLRIDSTGRLIVGSGTNTIINNFKVAIKETSSENAAIVFLDTDNMKGGICGIAKGTDQILVGTTNVDFLVGSSYADTHIISGGSSNSTGYIRATINTSGHMGLGVTPNANWPSNGDFRALQLGTGIAVFGRGSGDEDRGGISANYYHTGSAQKYIGNGHAGRMYFEDGSIVFSNAAQNSSGANASLTLIDRLRINSAGRFKINHNQTQGQLDDTWLSIYDANSDSSANDPAGISKNYAMINLHNYGTGSPGDVAGIGFGAGSSFTYTKGSIGFQRTDSYGRGALSFCTNNDGDTTLVNDTDERMRIAANGDVHLGNWSSQGTTYGKARLNIRGVDNIATSFALASSYLHIGGVESTMGGLYPISFGHTKASYTKASSYIGAKVTDSASAEKTSLVFATRNTTGDDEPTERLRIHHDGIPTVSLSPTAHQSIQASALVNTSGRQVASNNQFQTNGTNNLSAGWYTIAACSSGRASGRIGIRDLASSRHQAVTFYAGHHYGGGTSQNCINTIFSSGRHSGNPLGAIRIKAYGVYDGAMVQVYLRDGTNNCQAFLLGDNLQTQGWIMKNWVADGTDPGTVTNHTNIHNNMVTPGSYSDLNELQGGGMSSGGHILPDADNRWTLGRASYRWHEIFCMNSSNTTSDETLKQDIAALTTAEMNAAKRLSALFKTYRWKDAVTEKGTDKARIHTGIIAQQVKSAMEAESLDPAKYSFYCIDEWYEDSNETKLPLETATRQGDSVGVGTNTTLGGNIVVPTGFNKVTRYSIRYVELLAFISAYNEQRFASIESRLTALESS